MKNVKALLLLVTLFCLILNVTAQQVVTPKTEKVSLFFHQAMVEKSATMNLQAGYNEIILKGHSPYLQNASLIVEGQSSFSIVDFSAKYQPIVFLSETIAHRFSAEEQKVMKVLKDSLTMLQDSRKEVDFFLKVLAKEQQSLSNLDIFSPSQRRDSIPMWETSMEFYREKMVEIEKLVQKKTKEQVVLSKKIASIEVRRSQILQKYSISNPNEYWVVVTIHADKPVSNAQLNYTYMVSMVNWRPIYDVKISSDIDEPSFVLKAEVTQNSQEDWYNVPLVFSTEAPNYSAYLGELKKYLLYPMQNRNISLKAKQLGAGSRANEVEICCDFDSEFDMSVSSAPPTVSENSMIGKIFTTSKPQTLLSSHQQKVIPLETRHEEAIYTYQAIPKLSDNAYLRALIPNWEDLELLDAEGKIYLDNKFIANTYLSSMNSEDTMHLDIGPNKRIVTEREVTRKTETKLGSKITVVTIDITLKNNSNVQSAKLLLQDQIPITRHEDIKILEYNVADGVLDVESGIITWEDVVLAPGASKKITISYTVKRPKEMNLFLD